MKRLIISMIFLSLILLPVLSAATDVGGIIDTNTIWDLANSPYTLTSDVQVAEGVSLTIEPGVIVNGEKHTITVWGEFSAIGTDSSNVYLNNIFIEAFEFDSNKQRIIHLDFCSIYRGSPFVGYGYGGNSLLLTNSKLTETGMIYIANPSSDCYIEKIFLLNQTILVI